MKNYETPEIKVVKLNKVDVITSSMDLTGSSLNNNGNYGTQDQNTDLDMFVDL